MLEWKVYVGDFNAGEIKEYNIFRHHSFVEDCKKTAKKYKNDEQREEFEKEVRQSLMYHYWSKCEWEVVIDHWPPSDRAKAIKVDVYDQVMLNWDIFIDYLWNNKKELKKL